MHTFQSQFLNYTLYLDSPARKVEPSGDVRYGEGRKVAFSNNVFKTNDGGLAKRLRDHRACGVDFHDVTGADRKTAKANAPTGGGATNGGGDSKGDGDNNDKKGGDNKSAKN